MKKMIGILAMLFIAITMLPASAENVTYEVRSTVYDNRDPAILPGDFYWDANNFPVLWYQIKPGLSSELFYIHNTWNSSSVIKLGDKIPSGDFYYVSKPQIKRTKIASLDEGTTFIVDGCDLKRYYLMGFFGAQHMVMPTDLSNLSKGCNSDEIARILMDSDEKKNMLTGEEWKLPGGWSLVAQQIDVKGNKVYLELKKKDEVVDTAVVSTDMDLTKQEKTYIYKDDDDKPVFYCYVDSVFRGTDSDLVVLNYVFLRGDIITINTGDTYGIFDVKGFTVPDIMDGVNYAGSGPGTVLNTGDDALIMASNKDIVLSAGKDFDLYGDIYMRNEDTTSPDLKLTLKKKFTIEIPDCPDNVTPEVNSTSSDATDEIPLASVPNNAKVQDPIETAETRQTTEVVQSSAKAPGFEILIGFMGILAAAGIKK
ncbi:S-layer protein domain-containing protein [Methanomethylovorans sp.]|uniref:S-layer protein domain-containing protein n=1 Tax=Methanomethylovorans sp. TaxID=2758717 RepID=UPI00345EDF7F